MSKKIKRGVALDKYSGKWVAFVDEKIVAWADTLKGLMVKAKEMDLEKKVSVFLVPREDEGPYILISV